MKKGRFILLGISFAFLALTVGVFIGRNVACPMQMIPSSEVICTTLDSEDPTDIRPNINEMSKTQLMSLPGIGETLAERIVAYRDTNGPFLSMEDLIQVEGIGEKKLEQIASLVRVGG